MRGKDWKQEEINYLLENFNNMTKKELSKKMNRSENAIQVKANRLGLQRPEKYSYNKRFFQEINSEEKAYWLGFFYADGYTQKVKEQRRAEASIMLSSKDITHLKKFNKSINGNVEVTVGMRGNGFGNGKESEMCSIRLYSFDFVDDLIAQGCVPNKSKIIQFPNLSDDLLFHFIRGFYDGDGCIVLDKFRNLPRCDFTCCSLDFIESLRENLYKHDIFSYVREETEGKYRLFISGMENIFLFLSTLYKDSTIYLDRKYERWNYLYKECDMKNRLNNNAGHHKKNYNTSKFASLIGNN